jgi:PST family polysaccharide transporter
MSLTRKVTEGVSWLAVAQAAQKATTLVVTAILARKLLPEDFGLVALTLLTVTFISYFQDMGLGYALIQREDLQDDHLATAFWLNTGAGLVLALGGLALSPVAALIFREPRISPLIAVMMITLPINGLGWTSNALLQRKLHFGRIAIIEWLSTFVSGCVAVVLALYGAGVWALVAQNLVASVVQTCGRLAAAGWFPQFSFKLARARELFSFSLGALGYLVVNHGMRNADKAIIGGFLGATALGYYTVAYNLVLMPAMVVLGLVSRVMFPILSSLQNDLPRFRRAYLRIARAVSFMTFPLIVGLAATAPIFVTTIYGDKWGPAIPLVQVLSVIGLYEAIAVWGAGAWALGRTKITLAFACGSVAIMSTAFFVGVHWGLMGVAWGYVIVSPIIFLTPHLVTNRLMGLKTSAFAQALAPPLCASAVMGLAVWATASHGVQLAASRWLNLVGFITIGAIIYGTVLLMIGAVYGRQDGLMSWLIGRPSEIDKQPHGVQA